MAGKNRASQIARVGQADIGPDIRRRWRRGDLARLRQARGRLSAKSGHTLRYSTRSQELPTVKEPDLRREPWDARRMAELEVAVSEVIEGTGKRQKAEARYRIITELISDFAYVARLDPSGRFVIEWISKQASQIFNYPAEQIAANPDHWKSIIVPEDLPKAINIMTRSAQGESVADEIRFIRSDGTIMWLNISAQPIVEPVSGRVEKIFGAGVDITERKLAEEALSQSQARYHALFDESPVPLWEIDLSEIKTLLDKLFSEGVTDLKAYFAGHITEARAALERVKIIDANRTALQLFSQAFHFKLSDIVDDNIRNDANPILNGLAAVAEGRTYVKLEGIDLGAVTGARFTEVYLSVVHGYEHNFGRVIVSTLDLTGRYQAEQALRREARRLELVNAITSAALSQREYKSTLLALAEAMKSFSGADDCFITRWDNERKIPVMLAATGDVELRLQGQYIAPGEPNITRTVLETGHVLLAQPGDVNSLNQRVAPTFYNGAALAMPLQVANEKNGAAVLVYKRAPTISDEELDMWGKVAAQVSLVLSDLEHFERARRRAEELEKIERVSSELRQAQTFREILAITVHEMIQIVEADRGGVIIKRRGKWALEVEEPEIEKNRLVNYPLEETVVQSIMRSAEKFIYADPATGITIKNCPWQQNLDSVTAIPIKDARTTIALAVIGWCHPRTLDAVDRRLLTAVAEMAGNALQRASLVETLEKRVADRTRNLQILYDLSALSNRQQEFKKLTRSALKQLIRTLGGEAGVFCQLNPEEQCMEVVISMGLPAEIVAAIDHSSFDLERRQAVEPYRQPFLVTDIRSFSPKARVLAESGYGAAIMIPVREFGQVKGVICIAGSVDKLSLEEKLLASAVADLLATAVENAQLQKRSNDAAVMEERQRLARALHDSVTQSLYSLTLFTEAGREHYAAGNEERAIHYLERSSETARRALREMRMLLYELRPPELARLGLAEALRYRLEAVERRLGMEASLTVKHSLPLSAEVEDALFWIAQEALNNILRHASASKVSLVLDAQPHRIMLAIVDNGCGFVVEEVPVGGMGLVGMRERATNIGARLEVISSPGRGTRVDVKLRPGELGKWKMENE